MEEDVSEEVSGEVAPLRTLTVADLRGGDGEEAEAAFRLFGDMDFDSSGRVDVLLLRNYLCGDTTKVLRVFFEHPDTGILWREDRGVLSILDFERDSPASSHPRLVRGLVLHSLEGVEVTSLEQLYSTLSHLSDLSSPAHFDFVVPVFVVSSFNQRLELEIKSGVFVVDLSPGAVYDLEAFTSTINEQLIRAIGSQFVRMSVDPRHRQFVFTSRKAFRLLFSRPRSCCYLLGFEGLDTVAAKTHQGEEMFTDISLGIDVRAVNLLVTHLLFVLGLPQEESHFNEDRICDPEAHLALSFEQFRLLFINFFSDPQKLDSIRNYALDHFERFNFRNHYNRVQTAKRIRGLRRMEKQKLNAETIQQQRNRILNDFDQDAHGALRRHHQKKASPADLPRVPYAKEISRIERRRRRLTRRAELKCKDQRRSVEGTKCIVMFSSFIFTYVF